MTLREILTAPQRGATQSAVIEHVGKSSFEMLAAFAQQRFAALAACGARGPAQRPTVLRGCIRPSSPGIGIGNDRAHTAALQLPDLFHGEVAFIGHHGHAELLTLFGLGHHFDKCAHRCQHALRHARIVVRAVSRPHRHINDRAALQVAHVLRFVNHVRGSMLGAAHLRFFVVRIDPIPVARLAPFALLVKTPHRLGVLGVHAGFAREPFDVVPILLLTVAVLQLPQTRVGLQHARINPQMASLEQTVRAQRAQQHQMQRVKLLQREPLADHTEAGVIRRVLREAVAQEPADGKGVRATRRDGPLAGQVLEEAHHEHLHIHHRINPRASSFARIGVGWLADLPDLRGKTHLFQSLVHPPVEAIRCRSRQLLGHDPKLPLLLFSHVSLFKHGGNIYRSTGAYFNSLLTGPWMANRPDPLRFRSRSPRFPL